MLQDLLKFGLVPSILFFGIGYIESKDPALLFIGAIQFGVAVFGLYKSYFYIYKCEKKEAEVISKKRIKSQLPGQTSRTFKYKFLIENVKYTMPESFSMGGFKEYKSKDIIDVYIIDKQKKRAIPFQAIVYIFVISILLLITSFYFK